jgi:hypothetical protein
LHPNCKKKLKVLKTMERLDIVKTSTKKKFNKMMARLETVE